jgi:hypothetical protein
MLFLHGREIARRAGAGDARGIVSWAKGLISEGQRAASAN